jgi:hypothetical protein
MWGNYMTKIPKGKHDHPVSNTRWLRLIHAILGMALLAGGSIALYDSAIAPQEDDWAALSRKVFCEIQLLGGLWLLWGVQPEQTRPWTIAAFAGLWAAGLYQVLTGKYSCGCFGSLDVNPWCFLIFALGATIILLKCRPSENQAAASAFSPPPIPALALTAFLVGVVAIWSPPLVAVAGTATFEGRPLQEASLEFVRGPIKVTVYTDRDGFFRLPPIRPGLYNVSTSGLKILHDRKLEQRDRDPPRKAPGKVRRQPAEAVQPQADFVTLRRFVDEYSREALKLEF